MILKIISTSLFAMLMFAGLIVVLANPYQFFLLAMSIVRLIVAVNMYMIGVVFLVLL